MNDDTTAPSRPATPVSFTCPRCATSFASPADLYDHRLAPVDSAVTSRTGQPCQPVYGMGTPQSPAPVVYDLGPVRYHSWLCPDLGPSGFGDSRGPVLVTARVVVLVDAARVAA